MSGGDFEVHPIGADAELAALRAFAIDVMESWPMGDLPGDYLQEYAIKHGLLVAVMATESCGEGCGCAESVSSDEWPVQCYRKTALLTGKPREEG